MVTSPASLDASSSGTEVPSGGSTVPRPAVAGSGGRPVATPATGRPLVEIDHLDFYYGESQALQRVRLLAERVAGGEAKVLITGESGVGKDVIARYVHAKSKRAHQRYVALNCASFSETLLESEQIGRAHV